MKKLLTFIFAFLIFQANAQVVSIGSGTESYAGLPITFNYSYTYSQSIYLSSEINQSNGSNIYRIKYKGDVNTTNTDNWTIYLGNTTKSSFTNGSDWLSLNQLTEVFSGIITKNADNTITLEFSSPFTYTGNNLVIAVDENSDGYTNGRNLNSTSITTDRSLYYRNDNINPDPNSPPSGSTASFIPSIDIDFNSISCDESPSRLEVGNISDSSAKLSWTAGGSISDWDIEYGPAGFSQSSGTILSVSSNTHILNSLSANTEYEFYVKTVCGAGVSSSWVGPVSFTTNCSSLTAPYTQDFDSSTNLELDACWKTEILNNSSNANIRLYNQYNFSPPNSLFLDSNYDDSGTYYIISPNFSDLDSAKRVKFMIRRDLGTDFTATLEIGRMTNNNDYNTYSPIQSIDLASLPEDAWQEIIVPLSSLSGTGGHIVFKYLQGSTNDDWSNRLFFDDFIYEGTPSCLKPTNLSATNITGLVSADLAWTDNSAAHEWDIEYGVSGFTQGSGTIVTVTENPYTLSNLVENTTFDFYVKANCTKGESSWSNVGSFTTSDQTVPMEAFVGVNTTNPKTAMDIKGSARMLNRNDADVLYDCIAETEGAMGYDRIDKKIKVCTNEGGNGYEWKALDYE